MPRKKTEKENTGDYVFTKNTEKHRECVTDFLAARLRTS